jgi:hypothetical protein
MIPVGVSLFLGITKFNIFFFSNINTKGMTAKKATKNLAELKVKGPILSIPVS